MSELPQGWIETTISAVTTPFISIDPTREPEKEFLYIDIGCIDNTHQLICEPKSFRGKDAPSRARRLVEPGDVLFSTVRTYLKNIARVPTGLRGALTSTGIAVLRPSEAVDEGYLFRWVCSDPFVATMSKAQDGTMYPAVTDKDVAAGCIALPPVNEQRKIANKLDYLFARSKAARGEFARIPLLIEHYKQAILEKAFSGELTADWRLNSERLPPSSDGSASEELPSLHEEKLPALPEGWRYWKLPQLLASGRDAITTGPFGSLMGKHDYVDEGVPIVGVENVKPSGFVRKFSKHISPKKADELQRYFADSGDILITRSGTVGDICIFPHGVDKAIISTNLMRLRLKPATIHPRMFCYMMRGNKTVLWQLERLCSGSTRIFLNQKILNSLFFPVPPPEEQDQLLALFDEAWAWLSVIDTEQAQAAHLLAHLDQGLLAKAFRGELVPQDPNDEPADQLLERIQAEREAEVPKRRGRRRKA